MPGETRTAKTAASGDHSVITVRTLVVASVIVLAIVLAFVFLTRIFDLVLLILIAVVFAEGVKPMVEYFEKRRLPQVVAIIVTYVILLAILALLIALLVQPIVAQAQALAGNFPNYQRSINDWLSSVEQQFHISTNDLSGQVQTALSAASQILLTIGGYIATIIVNFVIVLVIGFLWLTSSKKLKGFVVDLFPTEAQELTADVLSEIGFRMGGYLRAVGINMVAVGLATWAVCSLFGLPSPLLLGLFAGITGAIPMIGPFLGIIPPVLLALPGHSPGFAIFVLVVLLIVQLIDANTVVPIVMNRVVALPALAVVLALLIGGALAGIVGALLAVPVAAAVQVLIVRVAVPAIHHTQGRAATV